MVHVFFCQYTKSSKLLTMQADADKITNLAQHPKSLGTAVVHYVTLP